MLLSEFQSAFLQELAYFRRSHAKIRGVLSVNHRIDLRIVKLRKNAFFGYPLNSCKERLL